MTDFVRNRAGQQYRRPLLSQADTKKFQVFPTLAAGDVQIKKDAGTWTNITTLPTATAAMEDVLVELSQSETDCAELQVRWKDAAGAEWCDAMDTIYPKDFTKTDFEFEMQLLNGDPATGKTITRTRSIGGGAFGVGTLGAVTEVGSGTYKLTIPHADLNGNGMLMFTEATCQPTKIGFTNGT